MDPKFIKVKGAKMHNLKNIDVEIPRNKLTVVTGVSGSGKSSLAFDTIYAEGQRRYVESLSTYARQFLNMTEKPEVESIEGLSPAISVDQKTAPRNPRSTVGTVTEIYDYLRLLFAKIGKPYDPVTGELLQKQSISQMVEEIAKMETGKRILLLSPVVNGRKGAHLRVFEKIKSDGFVRVRVDGEMVSVLNIPELDEKKAHTIEVVVDRLVVKDFEQFIVKETSTGEKIETPNPNRTRLADSVQTAVEFGNGRMIVVDHDTGEETSFSEKFSSSRGPVDFPDLEPRLFSFNSPHGACPECHGLGTLRSIDKDLVVPNKKLSIAEGAIAPWSSSVSGSGWYGALLKAVAAKYDFSVNVPFNRLSKEARDIIFHGTEDIEYEIHYTSGKGSEQRYVTTFEGVIPNLMRRYKETDSEYSRKKIEGFMYETTCSNCNGTRLRPEVNSVRIGDKSIIDVTKLSVEKAVEFFESIELSEYDKKIAELILKEISSRLEFLLNVGLAYLNLNRSANTLSGGEAQRIRLATQIGSKLSGVLYVLDEPSIGLHQRDNDKLIQTLLGLRDIGNTVLVVEHDMDTMLAADHILDIGPGAGKHGGEVMTSGSPKEIMKDESSVTGGFLSGRLKFEIPKERRSGNGKSIKVIKASENNLKDIDAEFPLGKFIAVTGVSGSGKSTLVNEILLKAAAKSVNSRSKARPGKHEKIEGLENVDKVINIDQSPIGRTPRSNPATYTGVFTDIRNLMAQTPEARVRGYKPGRFSFNVKGGRCEDCKGDGVKKIEMHFLPDIHVECEACKGKRYNPETLEVTYRGKNIADILEMNVEDALDFFEAIPSIKNKLATLVDVGLDYIHLGQQANTLSGGEAQRVKLATELSKRSTGKTLYILDEPTTGLHFQDVAKLLEVLNRLVDLGNTVLVIEHNLDVVKTVDHIVDIGPEGGDYGGQIVAKGTPEEVIANEKSYTGEWLKKIM